MMRRSMALIIILMCCVNAPAMAKNIDQHFHESFDVSKGASLSLEFDDGNVTLIPWDKDVLDIDIDIKGSATKIGIGQSAGLEVEFDQRGSTVYVLVKSRGTGGIGVFTRNIKRFEIEIHAPKWLALALNGDDGDVSISDWTGGIEINTDDGDVFLENITTDEISLSMEDGSLEATNIEANINALAEDGDLRFKNCRMAQCRLETEDGSIRINECAGNFDLRSEDGDIRLRDILAGEIAVGISDGDLDISLHKSSDLDIDIEGADGDVTLTLDKAVSARFDLRSDGGDFDIARSIRTDQDDDEDEDDRRTGRLGSGQGTIRVSVDDGGISLALKR